MSYLRAVMSKGEMSERALGITADAIEQNPANYTAWHYRRKILLSLSKDMEHELEYLNEVINDNNQKNYQVWYHRQAILYEWKKQGTMTESQLFKEIEYINEVLINDDAKNYHAWAHRQWFVREFNLINAEELKFVDTLLGKDYRNNSAWNHRFFVLKFLKNSETGSSILDSVDYCLDELENTFKFINKAPNNESAWNYAIGLVRHIKAEPLWQILVAQTEQVLKKAPNNTHARWVLLECYIQQAVKSIYNPQRAVQLCSELIQFDGIRKRYWTFRLKQLQQLQ